jgi:hypothetical protein
MTVGRRSGREGVEVELQVLIQGPDTIHPIMVEAPDGENPKRIYAEALAQGAPVVCFGKSCFRVDQILGIVIRATFVDKDKW